MSLFNRKVEVEVEEDGETLLLKGTLNDTRQDVPLHGIVVEMAVTPWDGKIIEINGTMPVAPMDECRKGFAILQELVGRHVRPGYSELVRSTVGSERGCSHLAALMMNMGNVAVQGFGAYLRKYVVDDRQRISTMVEFADDLSLVDSCVSWRKDGPLMSRYNEVKGDSDKEPDADAPY